MTNAQCYLSMMTLVIKRDTTIETTSFGFAVVVDEDEDK